jgi:hypothetical protein
MALPRSLPPSLGYSGEQHKMVEGQAGRVTACSKLQAMGAGQRRQHRWPNLVILQLPVVRSLSLSLSLSMRVFFSASTKTFGSWLMFPFLHFAEETKTFLRNEKIDSFIPNAYDIIKTQKDDPLKFLCPIPRSRRGVCTCPR